MGADAGSIRNQRIVMLVDDSVSEYVDIVAQAAYTEEHASKSRLTKDGEAYPRHLKDQVRTSKLSQRRMRPLVAALSTGEELRTIIQQQRL